MSRFTESDPTVASLKRDIAWPLRLTATGDLATVAGLPNVVAAIARRMTSRRGTLVHRPLYGVDYNALANAPTGDVTLGLLQARQLEQMKREPRVSDTTVSTSQDFIGDTTAKVTTLVQTGQRIDVSATFGAGGG